MTTVHIWLDDYIPFNEWFLIPYLLWFGYMAASVLYFFFASKKDYYRECAFLFIGMSICLIIYMIWPNCQNLRPVVFPRENVLTEAVKFLYSIDTATNVCPSIHVYNSIGVHIAISQSEKLGKNKWIKRGSFILMITICLSTVFLKQHSVFDGICAVSLACIMYLLVYKVDYSGFAEKMKERRKYSVDNKIRQ